MVFVVADSVLTLHFNRHLEQLARALVFLKREGCDGLLIPGKGLHFDEVRASSGAVRPNAPRFKFSWDIGDEIGHIFHLGMVLHGFKSEFQPMDVAIRVFAAFKGTRTHIVLEIWRYGVN